MVGTYQGRRVLYVGTGCGHVACVSADDGRTLWRFKLSHGGVNISPLVFENAEGDGVEVVAIHGKENIDSSHLGRMVLIAPQGAVGEAGKPTVLGSEHERWRATLTSFTSSPVSAGDIVYQTTAEGMLVAVDRQTGVILWQHKLGRAQLHASPTLAGDLLYVPMEEGVLHVLRPTREGPNPVSEVPLEGKCLGAPALYGGQLFIHTTEALYAFGQPAPPLGASGSPAEPLSVGAATGLQVRPAEILARPGESIALRARPVDAAGRATGPFRALAPLNIASDAAPKASVETFSEGGLSGRYRLRIVPGTRYQEGFEAMELGPHPKRAGHLFSHPPAFWSGAKMKWEVVQLDGQKVLSKTLDRVLFQRATSFFGHPESKGYTLEALVRSDGNRRGMGVVGVVNQRYIIALDGNRRELTVHSNHDRFRHAVPYRWQAGTWVHLKTRVDVDAEGRGVIRAKAWPKEREEPSEWTLVALHDKAHTRGAPGLFGFSPQSQHRVYVDDVNMAPSAPLEGGAP